jgi:uncharacterized protein YjbJ (UPF0337 family)
MRDCAAASRLPVRAFRGCFVWDRDHPRQGAFLSGWGGAAAHGRATSLAGHSGPVGCDTMGDAMNKDQTQGTGKDVLGKVQETAGQLTGDREMEAKGLVKQVEGKVQKGYGDAKDALEDATK